MRFELFHGPDWQAILAGLTAHLDTVLRADTVAAALERGALVAWALWVLGLVAFGAARRLPSADGPILTERDREMMRD